MKKLTLILSSIFAVQVLLAVALLSLKTDIGAFQSNKTFLELTQTSFDAVSIEQKEKPPLTLKNDKGQWLLPDYFNMPVDRSKFDDFSHKLLTLKVGWPVASTEEAAERFQVNKDKFERRIVFKKDGKPVLTLYLGSSPGFKKIHARVDGQNNIQAIDFSAYETSVTPEDWMQQDLIKIDPNSFSQIKINDFSLVKVDKDWSVEGLQANQSSNTAATRAVVDKLAALNYSGVVGVADKPDYHLKEPALTLTFKKQAEEIRYQLSKQEGKDDYVLKVSTQPFYFKVSKAMVDAIKEINLQKLVIEKSSQSTTVNQGNQNMEAPKESKK